jgi:putative acyl-CoA dehydrogenase
LEGRLDHRGQGGRDPGARDAVLAELALGQNVDRRLDGFVRAVEDDLTRQAGDGAEAEARRLVAHLAIAIQASLLVRHAPSAVADAFVASRIAAPGHTVGALPATADAAAVIERNSPQLE